MKSKLSYAASIFYVAVLMLASEGLWARDLPNFTEMAKKNAPAVVNISTKQEHKKSSRNLPFDERSVPEPLREFFRHYFGEPDNYPQQEPEKYYTKSLGSGFVISRDGYILTNHHVVADADEIFVRFSDRSELRAKLVGSDEKSDVAVLKVDATDLSVVEIGESEDLEVGEWVLAIGSPFGFDHSVTAGIVSAKGRSLPQGSYVPFIQTDVAINPGNSGGPLFNMDGEVVGINSQIYSRTGGFMGLSFAIPIDTAMDVVTQLKDTGQVSRGWLGVVIQDITRELAESFGMKQPRGALVAKVIEDSPAAEAGFEAGDIVLEYNGKKIKFSSDLPPLVGRTPVDEKAKVKILRNGKQTTLTVVIKELPSQELAMGEQKAPPAAMDKANRLGIVPATLSAEQRQQNGIPEHGILVEGVVPGGPAQAAGIDRGDLIVSINGEMVNEIASFNEIVDKIEGGKVVRVLVQRRSGSSWLAIRIPED